MTDALNGTVQYSYHPFGELYQVTDPESRITTINIDLRGLKTGMSEPSLGAWSYQYNAFGELTSQTNALAQTTTLTYDQAGRLRTRTEAEGVSEWTYYQSGTGAKGRLQMARFQLGANYQENHSYDTLGRPAYSTDPGHSFRVMAVGQSTRSRSPGPRDGGQCSERSDAGVGGLL